MTQVLLALAVLQQSAEHLVAHRSERWIFLLRIAFAAPLLTGSTDGWPVLGLWLCGLLQLHRFEGPYNGGSDKMTLLVLTCLSVAYLAPNAFWQEMALSYLALQLVLSYFVSGWVKLTNPDWRNGSVLADVFRFSAYPVTENMRTLATYPRLILAASWSVILLEVAFPLSLLSTHALHAALALTALFHLGNALAFGLNRFLWIWLCAYPALIWFQSRVIPTFD